MPLYVRNETNDQTWKVINGDYSPSAGEKIVVDSSDRVKITLPSAPTIGTAIEISKTPTSMLVFVESSVKINSQIKEFHYLTSSTQLIYAGENPGWISYSSDDLISFNNYNSEVLADNPYCYLKLDEVSGTVAVDSSSNRRNGIYNGTPLFQQEGYSINNTNDKSVRFNGTNTFISFSANQAISSPQTYALECKFRMPASVQNGGLFTYFRGNNYDREFKIVSGKLIGYLYPNSIVLLQPQQIVNDDKWHIVTLLSNSQEGVFIVVDGKVIQINPYVASFNFTGDWRIAQSQSPTGGSAGSFNGWLDDVSITLGNVPLKKVITRHNAALVERA